MSGETRYLRQLLAGSDVIRIIADELGHPNRGDVEAALDSIIHGGGVPSMRKNSDTPVEEARALYSAVKNHLEEFQKFAAACASVGRIYGGIYSGGGRRNFAFMGFSAHGSKLTGTRKDIMSMALAEVWRRGLSEQVRQVLPDGVVIEEHSADTVAEIMARAGSLILPDAPA